MSGCDRRTGTRDCTLTRYGALCATDCAAKNSWTLWNSSSEHGENRRNFGFRDSLAMAVDVFAVGRVFTTVQFMGMSKLCAPAADLSPRQRRERLT